MQACSSSTFGVILFSVVLPVVIGASSGVWQFIKDRKARTKSPKDYASAALESAVVALLGLFVLLAVSYSWFFVITIYRVHESDQKQISELGIKTPYEKSFIGSFAYTNTVGAFAYLAGDIERQPDPSSKCHLKITTQSENKATASGLRSIASDLGCYVDIEPYDPDVNVESAAEINQSVPGFVVIHAARDNAKGEGFAATMSSTFHVRRSYELPPGSPRNLVWIQIGPGSIWRVTR